MPRAAMISAITGQGSASLTAPIPSASSRLRGLLGLELSSPGEKRVTMVFTFERVKLEPGDSK
jgi:hypothetical protein